jgi:hypothetical protein
MLALQAAQRPTGDDAGGKVPAGAAGQCPMGKVGKLSVSRLILGTNVITFHIHSRGLKFVNNLNRRYNTDDKILETPIVAERSGINTTMTQADPKYLRILMRHRDAGPGDAPRGGAFFFCRDRSEPIDFSDPKKPAMNCLPPDSPPHPVLRDPSLFS